MAGISEQTIAAVRAADIVQVVGHFVQGMKKKGTHYQACCPFHGEKTPSFMVSGPKALYKCFGCGQGGDALRFVMQYAKLDFVQAVEKIAEICGISVQYEANYNAEAYKEARERMKTYRQHMDFAYSHFTGKLAEKETDGTTPRYPQAIEYARYRRLNDDDIARWGIGFAPNYGTLLTEAFKANGHLPDAEKLGLVRADEAKEGKYYDFFRNRLMFAIHNEQGEVVSFAGRVIDADSKQAKYINGLQSPLYNKSAVLYGLYQAAQGIAREKCAILTEGYLDVISMHKAGADNTIATCGTALTDEHLRLLKRYTERIIIMRDGDKAGMAAVEKDVKLATAHGFAADVLILPDDQDPDSFAQQYIPTETEVAHAEV